MFADPGVQGILALTGGSGGNRILPLLDYAPSAATPKFLGGFSDLTALINAVHAQTGLVTFHCPVARRNGTPSA
jgi:muramoyltetrapeptide carboxypeptidase